MSRKSNDQGRAYEFSYVKALHEIISEHRPVEVRENSSFEAAKRGWNTLSDTEKERYFLSAEAGVEVVLELEPLILEEGDDLLEIEIQSDQEGIKGDVRDVLILREDIQWVIGLSVKHNHFAVKHSRLSKSNDFGNKWYGIPCSDNYWSEIKEIFEYLEQEKNNGTAWRELENKEEIVYKPLLQAFINELELQNNEHGSELPKRLVEYLLGEFDFYKVIGLDKFATTQVQCFNLRGSLNKNGRVCKRVETLPRVCLPTRIVSIQFKPGSNTTVELYMDEGWQFSFRIHNASSLVEPSLKFDVQIIGMPTTIISINSYWRNK